MALGIMHFQVETERYLKKKTLNLSKYSFVTGGMTAALGKMGQGCYISKDTTELLSWVSQGMRWSSLHPEAFPDYSYCSYCLWD
jgi:hypothetical protein